MQKLRPFIVFMIVAVSIFVGQKSSVGAFLIPTTTKLHVLGSQPFVSYQPVTFTATVSPMSGPDRGLVVLSLNNNAPLFGGPVDPSGHATIILDGFAPGVFSVRATYVGNTVFAASTSVPLNVQVVKAWTATSLSSTNPNIIAGQYITFYSGITALAPAVLPSGVYPTGTISFYDGSTVFASFPLVNGSYFFSTNALTPGTHTIVASYSGDSRLQGSLSPQPITVTVAP